MDNVEQRVSEVVNDREHGSRWLVKGAITLLRDLAEEKDVSPQEQMPIVLKSAYRMAQARPAMAALPSAISSVTRFYTKGLEEIAHEANGFLRDFDTATERIAEYAKPFLHGQLITNSISGTVLDVLIANRAQIESVIVLESRPAYEGRETARLLSEKGLSVSLITDAQADIFLPQCQEVVVGADSVLVNGDVLNKAGTALLAWAARGHTVPFLVLCESWKISPRRWSEHDETKFQENMTMLEEKEPAEVLAQNIPGVRVRNFYFDRTPFKLVQHVISQRGLLDRRAIRDIAVDTRVNEHTLASVQKGL
jgi:ribose 1,5-bisphosphate isomerase